MSKTRKKRVKDKSRSKKKYINKNKNKNKNKNEIIKNKRKSKKRQTRKHTRKHTKKIMNKKTNTGRGIINVEVTDIDTEETHQINVDQNEGIMGELRQKLLTEEYHYNGFSDIEYVMFGDNEINHMDIYESFETHGIEEGARLFVKIKEGSHHRDCPIYDGDIICDCPAEKNLEES